jgi:cytochrome c oxidase subunit 2
MISKLLGLPVDASAHGMTIDRLVFLIHIMMIVLFVGWTAFFLYLLFRFRGGRQPTPSYAGLKTRFPLYFVAVIAAIEITLEIGFSTPYWSQRVRAIPAGSDVIHLRVVAQQFAWNIHYPGPDGKFGATSIALYDEKDNPLGLDRTDPNGKDDITSINQLRLPVGKPVIIDLTSRDVIHSLAVPLLRVKQDAIPGMSIPVYFTPTKTSADIRAELATILALPSKRNTFLYVAMQDYAGKDGQLIVKKGGRISADIAQQLVQNGFTQIHVAPADPVEIICGQLCGNSHYKMKGYVTITTPQEFQTWLAEQAEDLEE